MEDKVMLNQVSPEGDGGKGGRERVQSEEDMSLRTGKKPKGDLGVMGEDLVMDAPMIEKGVERENLDPNPPMQAEKKGSESTGSLRTNLVSYKDKLLKLNSGDASDSEEEDWLTRQQREDDEEDLMDESSHITREDPLCPTYHISGAQHLEDCKQWRKALIIKLLGKRIVPRFLMARLQRLWNLVSPYELIDLDNGFLFLRFQNDNDYRHVLEEGPWIVNDHYVVVQRWRSFFDPYDDQVKKMAFWVRIPGLPIELYTARHLWRIGSIFGRTLKVNRNSLRKSDSGLEVITERARFSRICVEVDLRKSFLSQFNIGEKVYQVGYEGLHLICFKCGVYGHKKELCSDTATQEIQKSVEEAPPTKSDHNSSDKAEVEVKQKEAFGEWIVVQRQPRGRKLKVVPSKMKTEDVRESTSGVKKVSVVEKVQEDAVNAGVPMEAVQTIIQGPEVVAMELGEDEQHISNDQIPLGDRNHLDQGTLRKPGVANSKIRGIPAKGVKEKGRDPTSPLQNKGGTENKPLNSASSRLKEKGKPSLDLKVKLEGLSNQVVKGRGPTSPMQKNQFEQNIEVPSPKGVGKKGFTTLIRDLKFRFKFDILALLETRTSGSKGDNIIKQLGFPNYFKQEADGYSGGIWILWDNKVVDLEIISTHHQFVHTKVVHLLSMKIELITFVYGSPRRIKRRILWAELDIISQSIQGAWLLIGDFNSVLHASEKIGGRGPILVAQSGPPRPGDHTITFKFMAAWLTDQDFGRLVRNSWGNNICWNQARSKFDREAKEWHQNVFRRNFHQKNKIYARLRGLDSYRNGSFDHNLEILQKTYGRSFKAFFFRRK
ncbi:uncharacterized protein LOC133292952 [Gastrolobium bilobum]|uniref:uncharacterized protein LOC133292952 n=1 Tax=Gastrolobium bilobum TaxID=150636 RepID=UPI002AB2B3E8|nr:uncharacterized protein LOC133292952 [Gastrolobium bilobum]